MSQNPEQCLITPAPAFIIPQYEAYIQQYQETFIIVGILGSLYGVLTVLSIISCYALFKSYMALRPSSKMRPTAAVFLQCLTILALFASTTIYMATLILNYNATLMQDIAYSGQFLWFSDATDLCWNIPWNILPQWISQTVWLQSCGSAATLTINVTLGDAIVCWRACIVWHRNYVVKAICSAFIATTFVLGILDTRRSCVVYDIIGLFNGGGGPQMTVPGTMFEGIPIGVATSVLSLSTNILATLLVAYKAWQSRRQLKGYIVAKIGGSQVEKLLTLLIESGAIYSAIWTVVVAFQVGQYIYTLEGFTSVPEGYFLDIFGSIMNSALLPIIAIYPTIIILLVALNRSHIERGISQHLDSMPTPHLAMTVNTVTSNLDESRSHQRSEALALGYTDQDGLETTGRHTSQERNIEPVIYVSTLPLDT